MTLGDESLKAIRAAHLLGIAVSAVALVLLFAPFETDFRDALAEARLLKDPRSLMPFEDYARAKITEGFASPYSLPREDGVGPYVGIQLVFFVVHKLGACCVSPDPPNDWSVTHALDYERPPLSRPLETWPAWVALKTPIRYWRPDWSSASLSFDTSRSAYARSGERCAEDCDAADIRALRFFYVRPVADEGDSWSKVPNYQFLAFFERGLEQPKRGGPEWWRDLQDRPTEEFSAKLFIADLERAGRSVVLGEVTLSHIVSVGQREAGDPGSIQDWLRYDSASREIFEMPRLQEHWSRLEKKTLSEAIAYMEAEQRRLRDVNLLGVAIPGTLCLVAIPLALALSHLQLWLHLRSCVRLITAPKQLPSQHFPWIGLYREALARHATSVSLTVLPALLIAALIIRCHSRLGFMSTAPASVLGVGAVCLGWLAMIEAGRLRDEWWRSATLQGSPVPEDSSVAGLAEDAVTGRAEAHQ